jgi:hypothetical protein
VGKLSDQMLESFLKELDKVEEDKLGNEGEAQRYFDHAIILKSTIKFLRNNKDLAIFSGYHKTANNLTNDNNNNNNNNDDEKPVEDEPMGLDLLRVESLAALDDESRQRVLAKNYSLLFSMSPYNNSGESLNSPPVTSDSPFHMGPPIPEINSVWFKLFLYDLISSGPVSLLMPKQHRIAQMPRAFREYEKFTLFTWGHDPNSIYRANLSQALREVLSHGPILLQCHSKTEDSAESVNVAFNDQTSPFFMHPSVQCLHEKLSLQHYSGYISLIKQSSTQVKEEEKEGENEAESGVQVCFNEWIVADLRFGIPLFDKQLNAKILNLFQANKLGCLSNLKRMLESNRKLTLRFIHFVQKYQNVSIMDDGSSSLANSDKKVTNKNKTTVSPLNMMHIQPTQCILFENGKTSIFKEDLNDD